MKIGSILLLLMLSFFIAPTLAQEEAVSADEVNAIAKKLYCPVCENIPLDTCGTAACQDWRDEIRIQLESGMNEQQIMDDFVRRFGDRVVGTPQDPLLRAISLVTPWLAAAVGLIAVVIILIRWRSAHSMTQQTLPQMQSKAAADDLRAELERDVANL